MRGQMLVTLILLGCEPQIVSLALEPESGFDTGTAVCTSADGQLVRLTSSWASLDCLGLTCNNEHKPASEPCSDPRVNLFLGTCASDFFACYAPSGACTEDRRDPKHRRIDFANGAHLVATSVETTEEGLVQTDLSLTGPGQSNACILGLTLREATPKGTQVFVPVW